MQPHSLQLIALSATLAASIASGQTPAAAPVFEVATIRQAVPLNPAAAMSGGVRLGMSVDGSRVDIRFLSMADLVRTAYKVKPYQVSGVENSMTSDRWDIQAKLPEGATKEQVPEMLQALLADRFKLKIHRDSKDQPVYALTTGKGGPKFEESAPDKPAAEDAPKVPSNQLSVSRDANGAVVRTGQGGTMRMSMGPNGTMHMENEKMTMEAMAEMLTGFMDRPVVDMTGLKGTYKIGLDLSMDDLRNAARKVGVAMPGGPAPGGAGPAAPVPEASEPTSSLFSTIQQLGLKLEARKAPVEIIVVDHVEKTPTEN
jgi:uncharacterized protein (TIGR03435 family)